ncbi:DNA-binding protein, partial [Pseudomonas aeruginosa]
MSQVAVIQQGPVLTMSSREIAELTGKKHKNVLRDIREMLEALRKDGSDLSHVREDLDSRGYTENFHLDRDLTETLISGYSVPLRYRVIRRLHELESSQVPSIPTSLPEALRLAADQAEQNQALRLVINEQAPKVQALERL